MKKFLYIAATALLLTSCTEDFKDWAEPQSNPQAEVVNFGNGSVASVGVIDFAEIPDTVQMVKVCDITAPTTNYGSYAPVYYIYLDGEPFSLTEDGRIDAKDLESYVVSIYGQAPEVRTLSAKVKYIMTDGTTATTIWSDDFTVSVIPDAPVISSAYYYIGTSNGWTPFDATYKLDNGGGDVYANPVFTVIIPATGEDNWFKIYPQETMDVAEADFWASNFIGYAVNGENEMSGTFVEGVNDQVAFSFKIPASVDADKYRLTFDMMNRTFTIEPLKDLGTPDLWYLVGSCIGDGSWGNAAGNEGVGLVPMYPQTDNYSINTYVGFFPAGQGFKLIHTPGSWDEQWGQIDGVLVKNDGGSKDITVPEDGYYQITYDMQMDVLTITKYTGTVSVYDMIGMPGGYQGWDPSGTLMTGMSTTHENHDWFIKGATYDATELKFAANGGWDINWGAATFPLGIGEQNGANIPVEAGTYDVFFNDILGEYYFLSK